MNCYKSCATNINISLNLLAESSDDIKQQPTDDMSNSTTVCTPQLAICYQPGASTTPVDDIDDGVTRYPAEASHLEECEQKSTTHTTTQSPMDPMIELPSPSHIVPADELEAVSELFL